MKPPWVLSEPLPAGTWAHVRERAIFECCKWDIQSEDHCVLANRALILEQREWQTLAEIAEKLATETLEAEAELAVRPELHKTLGLPRAIRKALRGYRAENPCAGAARVMRFDFHNTTNGWQISEANTDVPGGFIEASGFTELMAEHFAGCATPPNAADLYAAAIANKVGENAVVGLVHATAHSDDRQVMQYIAKKLEQHGVRAALLSPAHLRWNSGHAALATSSPGAAVSPLHMLVRFYPGEWLPLLGSGETWEPWFRPGATPMSNPGTALLVQSKRFPLVWKDCEARCRRGGSCYRKQLVRAMFRTIRRTIGFTSRCSGA